jgi:hypothetical protein
MALADDLILVPDEDIEYEKLDAAVLEQLAIQQLEPFIATSALGELGQRRVPEAKAAAEAIVAREVWDHHLYAFAVKILYDADRDAGLAAMTPRLDTERDPVILAAMIENMMSDVEWFQAEPLRALATKLAARVAEIPGNYTDPEERESFLALFGGSP